MSCYGQQKIPIITPFSRFIVFMYILQGEIVVLGFSLVSMNECSDVGPFSSILSK